ncbi:hypothetical protein RHGRI_023897 [Rhododendron griersonianum]|uniref:Uncharacterized protein n=1 Tax=Rhododendron griersonianum TaxID=479676 RepID=A0AAV6J566_9ERIC|nr:hypothetical protein RHGRI_023897 [Rhododendron griersonianum]
MCRSMVYALIVKHIAIVLSAGGPNTPSNIDPWSIIGDESSLVVSTDRLSCFDRNNVALRMDVLCDRGDTNVCLDGGVGVNNPGFWGMVIDTSKISKVVRVQRNYLRFYDAIRHAYPDIKFISNCDGSTQQLDHPAHFYDYHIYSDANTEFSLAYKFDHASRSGPKINIVNLKISIDGMKRNTFQSLGSSKTLITSSNLMDENSNKVAPTISLLENAGVNMEDVLSPYSFTSFDLLTESAKLWIPRTNSNSKSSI